MTWSAGTNLINCTASDSLANATGLAAVTELSSDHKCYQVQNVQINVNSGQTWSEENSIVLHIQYASLNAVNMTTTSIIRLGSADLTVPLKPIITDGCWYHVFSNAAGAAYDNWNDADDSGIVTVYGGVFKIAPSAGGSGHTDSMFVYFPATQCDFIGVNFVTFGGSRFYGTNFRIHETLIGGGNGYGVGVLSTADAIGIDNLLIVGSEAGPYLSSSTPSNVSFKNVGFRGINRSVIMAGFGAASNAKVADYYNCDEFVRLGKLSSWDEWDSGASDAYMREITTYDIKCINELGSNVASAQVRVVRTLNGVFEGTARNYFGQPDSGDWNKSTSLGSFQGIDLDVPNEISLGATDASGERPRVDLLRRFYNDGTYESITRTYDAENPTSGTIAAPPLQFSGFYITIRKYSYSYEDIPKSPEYGQNNGLVDVIILKKNPFVDEQTEATVAAYTGITITEGTKTIAITVSHTIQEIYDYVHRWCCLSAQMDFETSYDSDGIPGTSQVSPFETLDGTVFTLSTGWSMSGVSANVDLDGKVLELANGHKWVTVLLSNMEENSVYTLHKTGEAATTFWASGTAGDSGKYKIKHLWESTNIIFDSIKVRLQGYRKYETDATITSSGLDIEVSQIYDPYYKFEKGRLEVAHFRWRDDDGSESGATWLENEDVHETGLAKSDNVRLRIQTKETAGKSVTYTPVLQFRKSGVEDEPWESLS